MDSPRSGFPNEPTTLLQIETDLFDLYIQGRPSHPTVDAFQLHRDADKQWTKATLQVVAPSTHLQIDPEQIQIFSPITGQLEPYDSERIYPCFYEHQNYTVIVSSKQDRPLAFYHDNLQLRQAIKQMRQDLLTGTLNFRNEVGYTDFEIHLSGEPILRVSLEIFPTKIDYKQDYQQILQDVNEQIYNLAFDFLRRTYNVTGLTKEQKRDQSLTEFFSILKPLFRQLIQSVEQIHKTPLHHLAKENRVVVADKVKRAGRENISYLSKRPHLLQRDDEHGMIKAGGQSYRPTHLIETRRRVEYDTAENRFLRWALLRIEGKLKEMRKRLIEGQRRWNSEAGNGSLEDRLKQIDLMRGQIARVLRFDFLAEVGEMKQLSITLVLQMAPGYRDVYRSYLLLLKGLTLQGDYYRLSMKDVAQLYEYWCFLKIHSLLRNKYELVKQDIIRVDRGGLFVTLDKSKQASVTYCNPKNGEKFKLMYNRKFTDPTTTGQQPDNVLSLVKSDPKKKELKATYNYVLDAKYRLNSSAEYVNKYKTPGPQEDDINTMHRYRDAIVSEEAGSGQYERSMFGAYVLFPYKEQNGEFEEHHFYKSIKKVNVGALPFLPGSTRLVEAFLDELIEDSPEKAFERSPQPRGSQKYHEDKLTRGNVLIGALSRGRQKEQLAACLEHRFYYMPLKALREHKSLTQLEKVGIYQSKTAFGEQVAGIRYVGRVSSWSVVPRSEIAEVPVRRGMEAELYVRFEVDAWEEQAHVILPSGKGVQRCLLTSTYLLERANTLAELRLDLENKHFQDEWREQRRRGDVQVILENESGYVDEKHNRIQSITAL